MNTPDRTDSPTPRDDRATRAPRAVAACARYARNNSLGIVAIVMASGGTALAATQLPNDSVDTETIVYRAVHQSDVAQGAITGPKIATGAVRGRQVEENTLDSSIIQRRVGAACPTGQSIRAIARNGTVTCQGTDGPTGPTTPTGPAGGDLTGTYPNPTVAPDAVDSSKVADGSLTGADLADRTVGSTQLASIPAARALQTTAQSFPSGGSPQRVQLDTPQYAAGVTFDNADDQVVITTPGVYELSAELLWQSDANGLRFLSVNGSTGEYVTDTRSAVDGYATLESVSTVQRLSAGDVVYALGGTTSADSTDEASSGRGATLSVTYLGNYSTAAAAATPKPPVTAHRHLG